MIATCPGVWGSTVIPLWALGSEERGRSANEIKESVKAGSVVIGRSYEKGSHWQCDIEEPQSPENKNRYLEGCKIATSTRGDNDCSRGRSQEQASRHDASQLVGKLTSRIACKK